MTYSIVGHDPHTGEVGIATQSRLFAASRTTAWAEAGVGVVASQAFADPAYGRRGLALMKEGLAPQEALDVIKHADPGAAVRQIAILDASGRAAAFTGEGCVAAAGHMVGEHCAAAANMAARETVWPAMAAAFESAQGALADKLLAALQAAEREGGDIRGAQAAGLIVVPAKSSGCAQLDRVVDIRVDDHSDPVGEVGRLLAYGRAWERAAAALGKMALGDVPAALADLDAICGQHPHEPDFLCRRAGALAALGRMDEAREMIARACDIDAGWGDWMLRMAGAGFIPLGREQLQALIPARGRSV
jgi:uncharacterized Ntn-hydrolase superfamily protein